MNYFLNLQLHRADAFALLEEEKLDEGIKSFKEYIRKLNSLILRPEYYKKFIEEKKAAKKAYITKLKSMAEKYSKDNKHSDAIKCYDEIFRLDDKDEKNIRNYLTSLDKVKQHDLQVELAKHLYKIYPDRDNLVPLSDAYASAEKHTEAVRTYEKYIGNREPNGGQHAQLGYLYFRYYRYTHDPKNAKKTLYHYTQALNEDPTNKIRLKNTTSAANVAKSYKFEKECWEKYIELGYASEEDKFSYAACCMQNWDFIHYGKYFGSRFTLEHNPANYPKMPKPEWKGDVDLSDKTLLVRYEQGFGDTFLCFGYAPRLAKIAKKVIYVVQDNMAELLSNNDFGVEVLPRRTDINKINFDYHIPTMSVPIALKLGKNTISVGAGYIKARKDLVEKYKEKYFNTKKIKVGLSFKGNDIGNKNRDIPLKELKLFDKLKGCQLYCLTKDIKDSTLKTIFKKNKINNIAQNFDSFSDTAAAIENMDIVISSDNCILNLAGAMGKKCFGIFNYHYNSRWYDLSGKDCGYFTSVEPFVNDGFNRWDIQIKKIIKRVEAKDF